MGKNMYINLFGNQEISVIFVKRNKNKPRHIGGVFI
jgi:hypothetical protein